MESRRFLPNNDQISVIAATIILTFSLAGFISFPEQEIRFTLLNIYVTLTLNAQFVIMVVASILAASGSDWLIRNHPLWNHKNTLEHWVTPLLSALVLGFLITRFEGSLYSWISFFLGASLLMGILVAEYITVSPSDLRYPIAVTLLLAISFLLFLIFSILIRMLSFRLLFTLPSIFFATLLVSLRSLRLRQPKGWSFSEAILISTLTTQIAAALHYWPISPLSFGLALFGIAYALFLLVNQLKSNPILKISIVEPLSLLIIAWILAYWFK
ncbi:MAG: hypothetical protein N3D16_04440 [Anaerolineales bacterium]|nr:hypothetical protein [Anaerolineales bacterium]